MVPVQASSRQVTSGCAGSTTRNWPVVRPVQAPDAVRLLVVPSGAVATTVGTPAPSRSLGTLSTENVSVTVPGVLRRTWMSATRVLSCWGLVALADVAASGGGHHVVPAGRVALMDDPVSDDVAWVRLHRGRGP